MLGRLVLIFTVVPIVELALLIQVGRWVGLWPTLALVIGTGITGAWLTRREGLKAWRAFQLDVWEGRVPGQPILDGLAIFAGGALLLTPGLLTDLLGFALLAPPTRRWAQRRMLGRLRRLAMGPGRNVYVWTGTGRGGGSREAEPTRPEPRGREVDSTDQT